jgi:hypothetical protein
VDSLMARYTLWDNQGTADEMVSLQWFVVLRDMRRDVDFQVLEGHRTLERQAFFFHCWQCQCCNNGNRAAPPTPLAPHIRSGRADHAIDFGPTPQTLERVVGWLLRNGLRPTRPVAGEWWHVEVPGDALRAYYEKHRDVTDAMLRPLPKHVEMAAHKLISWRKRAIQEALTGKGPKYRRAVKNRDDWRKIVTRMRDRADKPHTRAVLDRVLRDRDGVIIPGEAP